MTTPRQTWSGSRHGSVPPPTGRHLGVGAVGLLVLALLAGCASGSRPAPGPTSLTPPILNLAGGAGAAGTAKAAGGTGTIGAPGAHADAARSGWPIGFGGWVLDGPLPATPTSAPVYRWAQVRASVAELSRLTGALGLTGTPQRHAHGWELTSSRGTLWVRDDAGLAWAYARADLRDCPPFGLDIDQAGADGGVACGIAEPAGSTPPSGPDAETARAAAEPLLALSGSSNSAGQVVVSVGAPATTVSLDPVIAGMPTSGIATTVLVDSHGVRGATGHLLAPLAAAVYPLRTARAAFEALANGPRPMLMPYCGPLPVDSGVPQADSSGSGQARTGSSGSAQARTGTSGSAQALTNAPGLAPVPSGCPTPEPSRVIGARLGLLLAFEYASSSGSQASEQLLVPAWFFLVAALPGAEASQVPVIAVDPAYLGAGRTGVPGTPQPDRPSSPGVVEPGSPGSLEPGSPASAGPGTMGR